MNPLYRIFFFSFQGVQVFFFSAQIQVQKIKPFFNYLNYLPVRTCQKRDKLRVFTPRFLP